MKEHTYYTKSSGLAVQSSLCGRQPKWHTKITSAPIRKFPLCPYRSHSMMQLMVVILHGHLLISVDLCSKIYCLTQLFINLIIFLLI